MSKFIAATRGNSEIESRSVPCLIARPSWSVWAPIDRGKNSYQEENSACLRSTQICTGAERVTSSRIGSAVSTDHSSPASAGPIRSTTDRSGSRSASTAARIAPAYRCCGRRAIRSSSLAPPSRSLAISSPDCPAAAFTSTACRQVSSGSLQASTSSVHMPCRSGTTWADQRSVPGVPARIRSSGPEPPARLARLPSGLLRRWPEHHVGRDRVVPLPEHRRTDGDGLADHRLGRVPAAGDGGGDVGQSDASSHADHRTEAESDLPVAPVPRRLATTLPAGRARPGGGRPADRPRRTMRRRDIGDQATAIERVRRRPAGHAPMPWTRPTR